MSYTTPQLDAAEAVAAMLTGRSIAGFTLEARSDQLLPTYTAEDLKTLKIDCVPGAEFTIAPFDRIATEEECPVNVGVKVLCGTENQSDYRQLIALLRGIAKTLMHVAPEGFRVPREEVTVIDSVESLQEAGVFWGVVVATYHTQRGVDE